MSARFDRTSRPGWKLLAALYPFGAGAAAVNLFFASLIASWVGWRVLTPYEAVTGGLLLGLPATWAFARHIRRLMDKAEPRA
ncbi:NnrT protein [Labrenzia sp. 011]|uniref:NnrT protein n=1 Tax=Labrenzia sp. 011 TaxID=2171494 RepID=UPI000D521399|nr:NnrT protein [Labrenzia sp. 011]PVB61506.1 NnrT protein [Labrenzia sp. 011]